MLLLLLLLRELWIAAVWIENCVTGLVRRLIRNRSSGGVPTIVAKRIWWTSVLVRKDCAWSGWRMVRLNPLHHIVGANWAII